MKYLLTLTFLTAIGLNSPAQSEIEWITWTEAVEKAETDTQPKLIFVDVYTDWCGWCKKMDKTTFKNKDVANYMNSNFYMVKLDAEQKEDIVYKDKTLKYVKQGRRGIHELAYALLQGKLSYPSYVFLEADQKIIAPLKGYIEKEEFLKYAEYVATDAYKTKDWQDYQQQ